MNPAPNLALVGPMGAGKSSIGKRLAARLDLAFVDMDQLLEQMAGVAIPVIFEMEGEVGFRRRETQLIGELLEASGQVISTGGGAVLADATRTRLQERSFVVYLQVSIDQQLERLARDQSRPLLTQGERRATLQALAEQRNPLYEQIADLMFVADGPNANLSCQHLLEQVRVQWQFAPAA